MFKSVVKVFCKFAYNKKPEAESGCIEKMKGN